MYGEEVTLNKRVEKMNEEQRKSFLEASKPLIKWLNDNPSIVNPHHKVIVEIDRAELVSGECMVKTEEFIKD